MVGMRRRRADDVCRVNLGRLFLTFLVACVAVLAAGPAWPEDNADQNIYVDGVVGAWDDWSWDTTRAWNASDNVRSFSAAGKISFAKAWGALRFHYRGVDGRGFDTNGFSHLEFAVNWGGTAAAAQPLIVYALRNGDFNKTVKLDLKKYSAADPARAGWNLVRIPLADLGVANVADLTDILLSGPNPNVAFWVDDVKLVRGPLPERATISVDARQSLRTLDGRHLGINTAAWDFILADPITIRRVQALGARFFRFPGGSTADLYHWEKNDIESSRAGSDTAAFMRLVRAAGGQAILTVNYGTGTPDEAARWVHYCNVANNFNVRYWEVGNENYLDSEAGDHDPITYARRFLQYYAAMKSVDPTIKVGMPGPHSRTEFDGWAPKVLQNLNVRPDFYVVHYYPQVRWSGTPHEDDANLLQFPRDWAAIAQIARGMLNEFLGPSGARTEILATENNSVSGNPGKQTTNLVNALYLADSLGQVLNTEIAGYMWWNLHNGYEPGNNNSATLYGHREWGDYGILSTTSHPTLPANTPYPTYHALRLVSEIGDAGAQLVASASNHDLLPAYASLRADGDLSVMVINKHSSRALRGTISVAGFTATSARVQQYGVLEDLLDTGPTEFDIPVTTPRFQFVFPSYSISVITLRTARR